MIKNSFSQEIKKEICNTNYNDKELKIILYAFINANSISMDRYFIIKFKYRFIAKYIQKNLNKLCNVNIKVTKVGTQSYKLIIDKSITNNINICLANKNIFSKLFIVGTFLAIGCFCHSKNQSQIEIKSKNKDIIDKLINHLLIYDIKSKYIKKNNYYILYLKQLNQVADFLKVINVTNFLFKFENMIVNTNVNSKIKRINNLDISNLEKSIVSSKQQIDMIDEIYKNYKSFYNQQSHNFKLFCKIRKANIDKSLQEIIGIFKDNYHINVSKSCLNYYIKKMGNVLKM